MTDLVPVLARPHPLNSETVRCDFPVGSTIADMVGGATFCRVEIGGIAIEARWWGYVRPHAGVAVYITRYPQGSGGFKTILRIVAFAALAVGAIYTAGLDTALFASLGSTLGLATSTVAGLAAGALGLVGSLVINALIPPTSSLASASTQSTDTLRSITGTSNKANPYGAIPCTVGIMLVYPTYSAQPWTELSGDDQYLRCEFDAGSGNPLISDFKIGASDLATYTDVETQVGLNPGLFSQQVLESAVSVDMKDGDTVVRTSDTDADEISLDLIFASGLFGLDANGNATAANCPVRLEYTLTGTQSWRTAAQAGGVTVSFSGCFFTPDNNLQIKNSQRKAVRVGVRWRLDVPGQYDVRVIRYTTGYGGADPATRIGDMVWTVLRTIRYTQSSKTGTTKLAMRIKATDQLNGTISQFNWISAQQISVWDGTQWQIHATENPAWIYRWLLRDCPANKRLVDPGRIDDQALIEWAAECEVKEYTFSTVLDAATTVFALLQNVCAAGRASFAVKDGKYSVVRDVAQEVPIQVFTPRNSNAFSGSRAFPDTVHALRVQFINPEANYQQDERIVYDDGYSEANATNFETFPLTGCTNANAAWRLGRYHLAVSRLRANTYTWTADIENLVCSRGDLVHVANDVINVGLGWGRLKVTTGADLITAVQTDETVTLEAGKSYSLRITRQDGTVVTSGVTSPTLGEPTNYLELVTPVPGAMPGDLFLFGLADQDVLPLIVSKIEASADFAAKITAVDQAPAVLTADAGVPPTWISSITGQPYLDTPEAPSGLIITSPQTISQPDDSGNTRGTVSIVVLQNSRITRIQAIRNQ